MASTGLATTASPPSFTTSSISSTCGALNKAQIEWGSWSGDLGNTRFSSDTSLTPSNISRLSMSWKYTTSVGGTDGKSVSMTPVVADDVVYGVEYSVEARLFALDVTTGEEVWNVLLSQIAGLSSYEARVSPVIVGDYIIVGSMTADDNGVHITAVNRLDHQLVWDVQIGTYRPSRTVITASPVAYNNIVYFATSTTDSLLLDCCGFRGQVYALDVCTGETLWSFDMIPNTPEYEGYYGISIWGSQFPIDVERNAIYIPTGNIFTVPQSVAECEKTRDFGEPSCIDPEVHFDAIVALDLTTGAKLWSYRTQAYESYVPACLYVPDSDPVCPDPLGNDYDVSTAPAFFTTVIDGASIDAMAFGSKSGWMFALRRDTGGLLWKRQIGPGSNLGGAGGLGIATDGKRIYCQSSNAYKWTFAMQETGGNYAGSIWAALDPATGNVLWVRRDPNSNAEVRLTHMSRCYGPITVTAGGVMFAGTTDVNGTMYALDVETGEILWSYLSGPGSVASSPSIVDGRLFWGNGYAKWGGYGGNTLFSFTLSSPSASVLIA